MKRLKLIRELFPLTKGYRTTYFLNFFLVIISGIMKISTPFFVLQVFDVAITKLRFDSLIFYTMLIVITTAIGSICEILYQRNISKFNRTLVIKLRSRCFEHTVYPGSSQKGQYQWNPFSHSADTGLCSIPHKVCTV